MANRGMVCVAAAGKEGDQVSNWIAIEPGDGTKIAQIGFVKLIANPSTGTTQVCRFWAIGTGAVHAYDCGVDNGGDTVYFRIVAQGSYYNLLDCGKVGGYANCDSLNSSQTLFADSWAINSAEASYACGDRLMGQSGSRVAFGNATYPMRVLRVVGGTWDVRPWNSSGSPCSGNYAVSVTDEVIQTWDTRN